MDSSIVFSFRMMLNFMAMLVILDIAALIIITRYLEPTSCSTTAEASLTTLIIGSTRVTSTLISTQAKSSAPLASSTTMKAATTTVTTSTIAATTITEFSTATSTIASTSTPTTITTKTAITTMKTTMTTTIIKTASTATSSSQISKLIILNGYDAIQSVEVVDLNSNTTTCKPLADYPLNLRGSFGDLVDGQTPLVCGGTIVSDCYMYNNNSWTATFPMNQFRFHFSGMPSSPFRNASHKFLVVGAYDMEVLTSSGWETLGIYLPKSVYVPCLMVINETSFLLAVGTITYTTYSTETYIFNGVDYSWISGPSLMTGRRSMGCGTIKATATDDSRIFIVVGGENAALSVELLDNVASQWRKGPSLPVPILGSRPLVQHPSGGVVAIGQGSATIYHLAHAASAWVALAQKIKIPRAWFTAFLVPDSIVNCV